jgi:hypothetical protein
MKVQYQQKEFPVLQNRVYDSSQDAINCPTGDIKICQDEKTGLIFNSAFNPSLITYDHNYDNEQSFSPFFKQHLSQVLTLIETYLGKERLIEVGCGKGYFLEMLQNQGADVVGFDSTYAGSNPRIIKKNFEPGIIISPAKGLILRHVLEHIWDPYEFLFKLKEANGGGGLIFIEVPCFDWILKKRAWYDIFYEHVNYFRLSDFDNLFTHIVKKGRFFGNQYLYIIADLSTLRKPTFNRLKRLSFPPDFTYSHKIAKEPFYVWGGASKGVIFSILCERLGLKVTNVIDSNPQKQGKFLPVTGCEIISPIKALQELPAGAYIYVMNSNYLEEIIKESQNKFKYITVEK